jgi:transcriptional regulator with XRE-family HTH domain
MRQVHERNVRRMMEPKPIQQHRAEQGMSVDDFARRVSMTPTEVLEWERSGSWRDAGKLVKAADALGVPWSALALALPPWLHHYALADRQFLLSSREIDNEWQARVAVIDMKGPTLVGGIFLLDVRSNGTTRADAVADLQRQLDAAFRQAAAD